MITSDYNFPIIPSQIKVDSNPKLEEGLTRENIADRFQKFLDVTYQIPCKENPTEITFLHKGEIVSWGHLTKEEKADILIECALPHHNKDEIRADPDKALMSPKYRKQRKEFEDLVPLDPRRAHGKDHGVRAAIFAPVFAYLYNFYHPNAQITEMEVLVAQFTALGHDSMRQSEGIDVYDELSATRLRNELILFGVLPELIEASEEGIARKDSEPNEKKSFIAKNVQCSDSAEYSRFTSNAKPWNPEKTDIYVELQKLKVLKNNISLDEFKKHLKEVTDEMNRFTADTSATSVRQEASQSPNYYLNFVDRIKNSNSYPNLRKILVAQNVIQ